MGWVGDCSGIGVGQGQRVHAHGSVYEGSYEGEFKDSVRQKHGALVPTRAGWQEYWSRDWNRVGDLRPPGFLPGLSSAGAILPAQHLRSPLHSDFDASADLRGGPPGADRAEARKVLRRGRRRGAKGERPGGAAADSGGTGKELVGWIGDYKGYGAGRGQRVYVKGGVREGSYEGEFHDGVRHGQGKFVWPNGNVYEGEWREGRREGHGRFAYANGDAYEGQWHDDLKHGIGRFACADRNIYEGEWREDKKHGRLRVALANGDVAITRFAADRPVGQGARWSPDRGKWTWADSTRGEAEMARLDRGSQQLLLQGSPIRVGEAEIARLDAQQLRLQGAQWSADRAQAWELQDGTPGRRISLEDAAQIAARVGLPVPPVQSRSLPNALNLCVLSFSEAKKQDGREGAETSAERALALVLQDGQPGRSISLPAPQELESAHEAGKEPGSLQIMLANGEAEISRFETGQPVGQGVRWSADRAQAWELKDGTPGRSISLEEAAHIAARIGLPVPPVRLRSRHSPPAEGRVADVKYLEFVSGNEYEGGLKAGKKHGPGKLTWEDGEVDVTRFEAEEPVGQGARWSTDRAHAWELQDGMPVRSISLEEAAQIAARIGLPVP